MVTPEAEFAQTIKHMLDERFGSEFVFDPILVRADQDEGTPYLQSFIVFDGDPDNLDPARTLSMAWPLWTRSVELGFPGVPSQSFVLKLWFGQF